MAAVMVATTSWLFTTAAHGAQNDAVLPAFSRAPYVQLGTPTSMVVVWRTDDKITPVVRYGKAVEHLDQQIAGAAVVTRVAFTTNRAELVALAQQNPELTKLPRLHSAPLGTFQYEARVAGLTPDTRYFYAVFDGEKRLTPPDASYHFITHPVVGRARPARFWVVGDSGTGREAQAAVHHAMVNLTTKEKHPLDFYLHVGDMAYPAGRDVQFQTRFFEMYEPTLRNTVIWASLGNHEGATSKGTNGVGPYFDAYVLPMRAEAGGVASGTEAFYSFDYGRIHFICLDSHDLDRKPTGMMARWLKADLEKSRADWLVAFWHHPPYTKGSHDSDREKQLIEMRTHIMPILESGGVDLVLTGHSHIYERSMLMDGAYTTPTVAEGVILDDGDGDPRGDGSYRKSAGLRPNQGTVQVVAGHGGTTLRRKGTMPVMRKIVVEHGSVIVDIVGDTLKAIMLNKYGAVQDQFNMVKRGRITPRRLMNPWQPPPWQPSSAKPGVEPAAEPPDDYIVAIPKHADWTYMAGAHPEGLLWTQPGFPAQGWKTGAASFGYGSHHHQTVLTNMRGNYSAIYIRHEFEVEQADHITELGLMIDYDDGFIAYLNGKEVVRKGVGKGSGKGAQQVKSHEAGKYNYYPLKDSEKHLKDGLNVLAIEGHNTSLDSSDFTLDPYLIIED